MRKAFRWIVAASLLAGALYFLSPVVQLYFAPTNKPAARRTPAPAPVIASVARLADVPVFIEGVGTARPLNTVTVRPQVDGVLTKILFQEGQDVKKGDPLAKIDPTLYQAQLDGALARKAQNEANLANVRRDLERTIRLSETNFATKQQADTQRAQVAQLEALTKSDQAAIDSARATLGYTNILAPIDGRTGLRNVDEGNLVRANAADAGIVTISQIRPIAVTFNLPQQQLARVAAAKAQGALRVDALAADARTALDGGVLVVIDNQIDQATGTVRLKAEFPNDKQLLWPGAFVNVRLLAETLKQVVVVPTSAIQRGPRGTFVYVVGDGDKAVMRMVELGLQDENQTVIASGVEAGAKVITTGFARLTDGTAVAVTHDAGSSDAPIRQTGSQAGREGSGRGQSGGPGAGLGGGQGGGQARNQGGGDRPSAPAP
jgi:multidrug efflux system membrane fusion protein